MNAELNKRVERLRDRVAQDRAEIASLDGEVADPGIKQMLKHASFTLDDVETFFLGSLLREERSPAEESRWLDHAEGAQHIAELHLKKVQDLVAMYGPTVQTFPRPNPA